jgi:hypothetical protein
VSVEQTLKTDSWLRNVRKNRQIVTSERYYFRRHPQIFAVLSVGHSDGVVDRNGNFPEDDFQICQLEVLKNRQILGLHNVRR